MVDRRAKLKTRSLERGMSAPTIVVSQNEDEKTGSKKDILACWTTSMGHDFKKRTFYKPTYCQHCSEMLWGFKNQGYQCEVCNYISHEKCMSLAMVSCLHLQAEKIHEHVPHQWTGPEDKKKKKWCNVCRKRIPGRIFFCNVCRIYAHDRCKVDAFNDCKRSAIYSKVTKPSLTHHWVEGNLPSSAKCEHCQKSCSTDLCLFGFKCGWCGITLHSNCLDTYTIIPQNEKCSFRDLRFMIVSPTALSVSVKDFEIGEEVTVSDDDIGEMFSPVCNEDKSLGEDSEVKGRPVIIIDGSGGSESYKKWRKRTLQPTYTPKKMTTEELLRISLRKFGISTSPDEFCLSEVTERVLDSHEFPYSLPQSYNGPLKLYIRKRCEVRPQLQKLKIFNSKLPSTNPFTECKIDDMTTFGDVIVKSVQLFELQEKSSDKYCIYENSFGTCERVVDLTERPTKRIQELSEESIRAYSLLRYYLHPKEETVIELYIWKVPADRLKSAEAAQGFIADTQDLTVEVGPLFPNQGGMVVRVDELQKAQKLISTLEHVKTIPNIHAHALQVNQEPLLVFVNTKSGGKQGIKLMSGFKRHLNPYQVYDLLNGGPIPGLYAFRNVPKFRIMVAGGDGTVGWVLGALDDMVPHLKGPHPPCGVLPLGTGNDLARALKWGGGYTGEKVMQVLCSVEDSNVVDFDRWSVEFCNPQETNVVPRQIIMNNYLGIGLDAQIALDFHQAREENPEKFNSRLHNKSVYLQLGVQKTFSRDSSADLNSHVDLKVDDRVIELPTGLKGLVILNIPSWGAGSEPWGSHQEQGFDYCCFNDGKVEVMGLSGPVHLGQIKGGIRGGIRLAQGSKISITLSITLPVQIDGEAWEQLPVNINIRRLDYQTSMLVKSVQPHFGRGLSQGQAKALVVQTPIIGQDSSQFSSRRPRPLNPTKSQPTIGVSTHTFYIKDDSETKDESDIKDESNE